MPSWILLCLHRFQTAATWMRANASRGISLKQKIKHVDLANKKNLYRWVQIASWQCKKTVCSSFQMGFQPEIIRFLTWTDTLSYSKGMIGQCLDRNGRKEIEAGGWGGCAETDCSLLVKGLSRGAGFRSLLYPDAGASACLSCSAGSYSTMSGEWSREMKLESGLGPRPLACGVYVTWQN